MNTPTPQPVEEAVTVADVLSEEPQDQTMIHSSGAGAPISMWTILSSPESYGPLSDYVLYDPASQVTM